MFPLFGVFATQELESIVVIGMLFCRTKLSQMQDIQNTRALCKRSLYSLVSMEMEEDGEE